MKIHKERLSIKYFFLAPFLWANAWWFWFIVLLLGSIQIINKLNFQIPLPGWLYIFLPAFLASTITVLFARDKAKRSNIDYKRLEVWIEQRIGKPEKNSPEFAFKERLDNLYKREREKTSNPNRLNGFRRYIEKNAYKNMLK